MTSHEDVVKLRKRVESLIKEIKGENEGEIRDILMNTRVPITMASDAFSDILSEIEVKAPIMIAEKVVIGEWLRAIESRQAELI